MKPSHNVDRHQRRMRRRINPPWILAGNDSVTCTAMDAEVLKVGKVISAFLLFSTSAFINRQRS